MKNIAEVNTDDILTQLNNLNYDDGDDLKLLDDEDIKVNDSKSVDDDLSDFYMNYNTIKEVPQKNSKVDLYTEKPAMAKPPVTKPIEVAPVQEKKPEIISSVVKEPSTVDEYLNRKASTPSSTVSYNKPSVQSTTPSYNRPNIPSKSVSHESEVIRQATVKQEQPSASNDLNQLFNKVSNNVKGASEIVNRNAEIKRKIEEKFNELRAMQQEHENNKKRDYEEINAYRDEVYSKLQQKKVDIENDIRILRNDQEKLEKEKKSFEDYKASSLANLNKLEKELKDSYETRNKNIEQVEIGLVKRKEQLDNERNNINKEKEQIKKERDELAKNLVQFNKLVSDFTQGIDSF